MLWPCQLPCKLRFEGKDLTGGDYLVTNVKLKVNGGLWHNSGSISTVHDHNYVEHEVGCGETSDIEVIATNEHGQTVIATGSITTPVPEP